MKITHRGHGLSIKSRITMWYAAAAVCIFIISACFLYVGTIRTTEAGIREKLSASAEQASAEISYQDGQVKLSEKLEQNKETQVLILGKDGKIYYGEAYRELAELKMTDRSYQKVTVGGVHYYVYDKLVFFNDSPEHAVWVRSFVSMTLVQLLGSSMIRSWILLLPVLLVIFTSAGYLIAKRAFRPISQISDTAREIAESRDLTKRIDLQKMQKDELYELSSTFNEMFEKLQTAFEREKQFTSDASHELRTPAAVIMAQAEYLEERYQQNKNSYEGAEQEKKAIETILVQTARMSRLITELLMISRMENHKLVMQEEEVDVTELVEMVRDEMEEQAEEKSIHLEMEIADNIVIQADQTMLMRVFVNLIGNAIQYGKQGGYVKIKTLKTQEGKMQCSIEDNGIGIAPENMDRIWQRFYQEDPARTKGSSGSGLGLFMVKWIIDYYGGTISASSRQGEGSSFTFTL